MSILQIIIIHKRAYTCSEDFDKSFEDLLTLEPTHDLI